MRVETDELMSIGRFARLTGLSVKALRHYDELGLLRPAQVDTWTGYRWYAQEQGADAAAIRRLRELQLPLDEVGALLHADETAVREGLAAHRARLEGGLVETRRILAELDRLIEGKEPLVSQKALEVTLEQEPALRVAVVRDRVHVDEMLSHVPATVDRVGAWLIRRGSATGPPMSIYLDNENETLDVEVGWPVGPDVEGDERVAIRELPAARAAVHVHCGPYDELASVYGPLGDWIEAQGLQPAGPPRESYVTDPDRHPDPSEWRTRIAWPVA